MQQYCNNIVFLNEISCSTKSVTCSVPTGIYSRSFAISFNINDLKNVFSSSTIQHSADNTDLIFPSTKLGTIESIINNQLKQLVQWLRGHKLSKTGLIIFQSPLKELPCEPDIRCNSSKLKLHTHVTYSGIFIVKVLY